MTSFKDIKIESPALHLVSGMPGGGKTVTCFSIGDKIHERTKKEMYVEVTEGQVGIPDKLPKWIHGWRGADYPLDSIVLSDDTQLNRHARSFGTNLNVEFDKLLSTQRHDRIDYILDSQTMKAMDVKTAVNTLAAEAKTGRGPAPGARKYWAYTVLLHGHGDSWGEGNVRR